MNSDGIVSAHPAAIDFTILTPIWLRWWFLALIAAAAGALAYAATGTAWQRLLEMVAHADADRHRPARRHRRQPDADRRPQRSRRADTPTTSEPLASIARIARESVSSMSDIVWAINPKRDSLLDLTRRMRQHAEEVFTLRDIELRFDAPGDAATACSSASTFGATCS